MHQFCIFSLWALCCSESIATWTRKDLRNSCHYELYNDAMFMFFVDMMLFTKENRILLKILKQDKCYSARQLLQEYCHRQRSCLSLDWLLWAKMVIISCTGNLTLKQIFF